MLASPSAISTEGWPAQNRAASVCSGEEIEVAGGERRTPRREAGVDGGRVDALGLKDEPPDAQRRLSRVVCALDGVLREAHVEALLERLA